MGTAVHRRRRAAMAIVAALAPIAATVAIAFPTSASAAVPHPTAVSRAAAAAIPSAVPAPPAGWTTTFSDDFNGAANTPIDNNWIYDLGTSYPGGAGNWGTGEVESETNSTRNVYQDGAGHLVIKPIRDAQGNWTSGRVETARTDFAAPPGGQMEITASIEQPNPANGLGYWPAFWAMGANARPVGATNWPSIGEFDIMEDVNALSKVSHTFHCGVDPGGPCNETTGISSGLLNCGGCQTAFHTYSVIIDRTNANAEQLRFYTDNVLQHTVNQNQVDANTWATAVDHGFFAILNVAIGGVYPFNVCQCTEPTAATTSGAPMTVDYVAVYTTNQSGSQSVATPTFSPAGGTYASAQSVTLSDATSGSSIRYTLDGSAPTAASTLYTGPINVAATTTVKAIGLAAGLTNSATASATYTIGSSSPDYTQSATQLNATQAQLSITPTTPAAYVDVHYLINGAGQQNFRMTNNSGTWTQTVSSLTTGTVLEYWFTYEKSGAQYDTPHFTYTQGAAAVAARPRRRRSVRPAARTRRPSR
ncbi:chitobiase/beta-hexosaminidase C-terminal domain-containing protein [Catenulispora rubra]|uniref:chitobiase/beta-hexosaminidase C-terminal domain-containing protein n=1 Tax=Catenulispora rubra TaxID=280293 RepID=UPI00189247C6|nr:chitobiase/beta-hexosaminidase C-terminal domain-containing protein [Catenulispora rubra]